MKTDIWMPLYIGDYLAATSRLSMEQHGAYLLLLMDEWKNGPLPNDSESLRNIARCSAEKWDDTWRILQVFFKYEQNDTWVQERLERERAACAARHARNLEKAVRAINKRWENTRRNTPSNTHSKDQVIPEPYASSSSSSTHKDKDNTCSISPARDSAMEMVYQAYPRKVGKPKALIAILAAVRQLATGKDWPKLDEAEALVFLLGKARDFANSPAGQAGEFTPHPATWFNQGRYLDDPKEWQRGTEGGSNEANRNGRPGQSLGLRDLGNNKANRANEALARAQAAIRAKYGAGDSDIESVGRDEFCEGRIDG